MMGGGSEHDGRMSRLVREGMVRLGRARYLKHSSPIARRAQNAAHRQSERSLRGGGKID
jgi:hypothetical protein